MNRLKRILFPTDFSPCAEQALAHAVTFAEHYHAELHLLHVVVLHGYDPHNPDRDLDEVEEEIAQKVLAEATDKLSHAIDASSVREFEVVRVEKRGISAQPVILQYAEENDIDLIVMGTHGRRGLGQFFLGSVAEEVVRRAQCPVLTVRERKDPRPVTDTAEVLVPLDFSDHSRRALRCAIRLARMFDARLQLLHVVEQVIHPSFYAIGKTSILELNPDIVDRSRREMERWLAAADDAADKEVDKDSSAITADTYVIDGRANRDIVKFAEDHGSDLIVIATHGLTGLDRFLMGSTTQKVVRRAPCPVFTVKSFGKSLIEAGE